MSGLSPTRPALFVHKPCDARHLRFVQNRALERKVSDEFTVPLCRGHHREHGWGQKVGLDATSAARKLWFQTHPLRLERTVEVHSQGAPPQVQLCPRALPRSALDRVTKRIDRGSNFRKRPRNAVSCGWQHSSCRYCIFILTPRCNPASAVQARSITFLLSRDTVQELFHC